MTEFRPSIIIFYLLLQKSRFTLKATIAGPNTQFLILVILILLKIARDYLAVYLYSGSEHEVLKILCFTVDVEKHMKGVAEVCNTNFY